VQTTTAGKTGFITSLYVAITPLLGLLFYRQKISGRRWISIVLAIIGLLFLFFDPTQPISGMIINWGDVLVLIGAIFCSLQILFTGQLLKGIDITLFSMLQLAVVATCSFITAFIFKENYNSITLAPFSLWGIWCYIGIACNYRSVITAE